MNCALRIAACSSLLLHGAFVMAVHGQAGAGVAQLPKEIPRATQPAVQANGMVATATTGMPATPAMEYGVPPVPADPSRHLGVGDQVTFLILEDRDPAIVLRVTDSGELEIPYIGRVNVLGKTTGAVAAEIKRRLEADYYYTATVRLGIDTVNRVASIGRINVAGAVRAPGVIAIMEGEKLTVSAAILKAGGFTQFGDSRKVKVTRKGSESGKSMVLDVKDILENGKLAADVLLEDGDYVYVPQRLITW